MTSPLRAAGPATLLLLAACSQPVGGAPAAKPIAPRAQAPAANGAPAMVARINDAAFSADAAAGVDPTTSNATGEAANATGNATANATGGDTAYGGASGATAVAPGAPDPVLIKAQVLMARAGASPGVVDGRRGSNFQHAVAAYARINGLDGGDSGTLTAAMWAKLTAGAPAPVAATYTITPQDAAGLYSPDVGEDLVKMARLDRVGYARPTEMLAERFHMAEAALKALNPGADFGRAGTVLVVAQVGQVDLPKADHIEVDKAHAALRVYDRAGQLIAFMPATVGAVGRQSPSGVHKVVGVAHDPKYTYDPKKLTWGPRDQGKFVVPAGPNNPVGVVWIDLNAPSYGLHGSPQPDEIGKTASHGCVRLTNWDATELAAAVKPGVVVKFINSRA